MLLSTKGDYMDSVRVIVLDFDNCIALDGATGEGSDEIKDKAWFSVFSDIEQSLLHDVIEDVKQRVLGGKGDRWDIIKHVLAHFGKDDSDESTKRRSEIFNDVVQSGIKGLPIWEDARKLMSSLSAVRPLYINTGTPREAAMHSLDALGLAPFFKGVYTRPGTKVANLRDIIAAENVPPSDLVFADDTHAAYEAANVVGCKFVGVHTKRNKLWQENAQPFPLIRSLHELPKLLGLE